MSDAKPTDGGQATDQLTKVADADWKRYGTLALGAVLGLIVNSVALIAVVGGDALGIADGVAYLAPVVILAAGIHERYNSFRDTPFIGPLTLFLTIALANTISLTVKVFRMGGQSDPVMSVMVLGLVALMFTPGAFLGVWAVRRWVL